MAGIKWHCKCDCGADRLVLARSMLRGASKSCGCYSRDVARENATKHLRINTPEYSSWASMIQRCTNPNDAKWSQYGGRGISVCSAWMSFDGFFIDMGERPAGTTIDRINVNGNYEPGNCRWATPTIQSRNRRPHRSSKTGISGVTAKRDGRWNVTIGSKHIGIFKDFLDACCARRSAEAVLWL